MLVDVPDLLGVRCSESPHLLVTMVEEERAGRPVVVSLDFLDLLALLYSPLVHSPELMMVAVEGGMDSQERGRCHADCASRMPRNLGRDLFSITPSRLASCFEDLP